MFEVFKNGANAESAGVGPADEELTGVVIRTHDGAFAGTIIAPIDGTVRQVVMTTPEGKQRGGVLLEGENDSYLVIPAAAPEGLVDDDVEYTDADETIGNMVIADGDVGYIWHIGAKFPESMLESGTAPNISQVPPASPLFKGVLLTDIVPAAAALPNPEPPPCTYSVAMAGDRAVLWMMRESAHVWTLVNVGPLALKTVPGAEVLQAMKRPGSADSNGTVDVVIREGDASAYTVDDAKKTAVAICAHPQNEVVSQAVCRPVVIQYQGLYRGGLLLEDYLSEPPGNAGQGAVRWLTVLPEEFPYTGDRREAWDAARAYAAEECSIFSNVLDDNGDDNGDPDAGRPPRRRRLLPAPP